MLRVALDLRPTEPGFKAHVGRGTGRYTSELYRGLQALAAEDSEDLQLVPLSAELCRGSRLEQKLISASPAGKQTLQSQFVLPRVLNRCACDVAHFFSHGDAPVRSSVPTIVTVLDLIPLRFPELYRADKTNLRFKLARALENKAIMSARGIVAISEATKRDVVEILGVDPEKIWVTPLAVDSRFQPVEGAERLAHGMAVRSRLGLPQLRPLLPYVGGIDGRKNLPFLLKVLERLCEGKDKDIRPCLVLCGNIEADDHYPALREEIRRRKLTDDVILQGFVADEDLPALYQVSDIKVFPSLYEGFGLTVLEAMACGLPVVAGNNSSLPEVVGPDGGILLADNDLDAWVREIQALLDSSEQRERIGQAGAKRAQLFSWERTARETLAAYRHFSGETGSKQGSQRERSAVSGAVRINTAKASNDRLIG